MASTHDPTTSATASITPDLFRYSRVVIYIAFCHTVMGVTWPNFAGLTVTCCDVRLPESRRTVNIQNVPPSDSEHSECPTVRQSTFPLSDTRTLGHLDTQTLGHLDTQTLGHLDTQTLGHLDTWMLRHSDAWTRRHMECPLSEAAVPVQS